MTRWTTAWIALAACRSPARHGADTNFSWFGDEFQFVISFVEHGGRSSEDCGDVHPSVCAVP